jgi:phosphoribosylamine--glycine ligase
MNILVIGSGGREHALVWKLRQSPQVKTIFCAPGNAGIEQLATVVQLKPTDVKGLLKFAKEKKIDLTVVGSEQPLVEGLVDTFEEHGFKVFGPSKSAAQLEGSKAFSKDFIRGITFQPPSTETLQQLHTMKQKNISTRLIRRW